MCSRKKEEGRERKKGGRKEGWERRRGTPFMTAASTYEGALRVHDHYDALTLIKPVIVAACMRIMIICLRSTAHRAGRGGGGGRGRSCCLHGLYGVSGSHSINSLALNYTPEGGRVGARARSLPLPDVTTHRINNTSFPCLRKGRGKPVLPLPYRSRGAPTPPSPDPPPPPATACVGGRFNVHFNSSLTFPRVGRQ